MASGVAARSMAVADGGRRLRQWSARSMRVTPSCPRPSAAPIARARGRSVEGTCVGRGATATRGRGRRGRALIVRAPSKPAGEFANAPLHRLGCSLGSTVRHRRGLGLAARGTSGRAVWSCVRRRRPRGHWRAGGQLPICDLAAKTNAAAEWTASRSATPSRRTAPVAPPAWHQVEVPLRWCIVGLACRCSCRRRVAGSRPEPPRGVVGSRSVKPVGATACAT